MWALIGKLTVGYVTCRVLFSLLKGIYSAFIASALGLNLDLSKTGKWAVVTGATDGIGKAYAFELAKRGLDIVLISRTAAKLQTVAEELKAKYSVSTKTIAADFTKTDIYEGISKELSGLDVGVLVNNVGMSYDYPEYLSNVEKVEEFSTLLLNINIQSVNRMTMMVLPGMEERKRGAIMNISSMSAVVPTPFLTVYAASKSYVECFSRNLGLEVSGKGVCVQCVVPGFVVSNLSKMRRANLMVPNPDVYVRQAIATVGVEARTAGYFMHKLMIYGVELQNFFLPGFVINSHMVGTMLAMRKRALKKKEREAKAN